ncbi:YdeI/OmpD-associated family protein [Pseudosulfitobacter sp. DSM 107133]|uniref:YdeI/OmpD-associated family protein n=1 Tax=Pseudosulfitobacter sp. DSM 107133 TaxID=2883100 RepID=UPI0019667232|nr:YdeI/OmpD-associated family protein [Pseudosulfitobacter sp. DSM 107133]UOA26746.1 hypothetical protein DSM107133_01450 [Pseudosulfitobacter sp. DSM 107133]
MMITEVDDFFTKGCGRCARFDTPDCSVMPWRQGLAALHRLCCDAGLEPAVKWAHPCYLHAGQNIALIGAFRGDFRLSFFNAALLKDPDNVLEPAGPNTKHPNIIRFTTNEQVAAMAPIITAYLGEAMGYAAAGITPPQDHSEPDMPDELAEALDADPELAEAFHALTPGRRKSYVINLNGAKQPETRIKRIARFRDKIIAGKGATDR